MNAAAPARLAPGFGVRAWRHYFGRFDPAARLRLHPGARATARGIEVLGPPRPATPEELALLDGLPRGERPALEVFTTPALLRDHFGALDPDEIPAPGEPPSPRWLAFGADVAAFLAHVQAPLATPYGLLLDVRDPEQPPPLLAGGSCRTLLLRPPEGAEAAGRAAHVNLGDVPAPLVFWNVPLPEMLAMLRGEGVEPPPDPPALVTRFVERFPGCPPVRLLLAPGEGVFVPYPWLAHDFDASGADDLVVTLTVVPGP